MLVPGDPHFGSEDRGAWDLMLSVAVAFRTNTVVLTGDTFDSIGISRHGRPARNFRPNVGTIKDEAARARPWLEYMDRIVSTYRGDRPGGLYLLEGNHEAWWQGVQDEFPGFLDTEWYEVYGDILDGWHVFPEHTALKFGPLLVCHGHRLRGSLARQSASSVLSNYPGQNTIYGHSHRMDVCTRPSYKYGEPVTHGAWTVGHLKDVQSELKDRFMGPMSESHQQGFGLVFFHEVEGEIRFNVELIPIHRTPSGRPYAIACGIKFD